MSTQTDSNGNQVASHTVATLTATSALTRPEFLRLPHPGQRCPLTGMSRSALNSLILPTTANGFKPDVRSFCLRKKGSMKGVRLIDYQSLADFIRAAGSEQGVENQ